MSMRFFVPAIGDVLLVPTWPSAGAPTSGASGTFAGIAEPGDMLIDTTTGNVYSNGGTSASPTWNQIGTSNTGSANLAITGTTGSGAGAGGAQAITGGTGGATGAGGATSLTGGTAGATSGTGGAAALTGGASGGTTGVGGAAPVTGGAGSGASAGGAASLTGGVGGATGAGGAAAVTGGAGGATSGTGGAATLTGGAGSAGNASGGSAVLAGGAKNGSGIAGGVRVESIFVRQISAPTAKTVSATLTAAELLAGIITINQGAAGASNLQAPTGTAIQAALPADFATGDSFDVSFINISTVAAEIASLTVNTDVTIVGTAAVAAIAAGVASSGVFRFRKTADHVFVAYRIS